MTASKKTIELVYDAMIVHINKRELDALIVELTRIPGNASFKATIEAIVEEHLKRQVA